MRWRGERDESVTTTLSERRPSLLDRVKLAWNVYSRGLPWLPWKQGAGWSPRGSKAAPFAWPSWRLGQPQWHIVDYATYAEEGFNANTLIYSAIMYKVRALSQAPLIAYRGDWDHPEPVEAGHQLAQLIARPNPYMGWRELQGLGEVYLNLDGNCYLLLIRPEGGGFPKEIYPLRPDRIFIVPLRRDGSDNLAQMLNEEDRENTPSLIAYLYVPEGRSAFATWSAEERRERIDDGRVLPIMPDDLMHVKLPNPLDPLEGLGYGLSPVSSLARSAEVDNAITRFLDTFFKRGTMMAGLLRFDWELDDDEIARIRERWKQIYGGESNWADVGVLGKGVQYQRIGLTFNEMGFEALDERNESRILGPFGVPPILVGTRVGLNRSTYSNYEQARRAFWEDTFRPELGLFEQEFWYYLRGDDGAFVKHDFSRVPALQKDVLPMVEAAAKLFSMGVPANQALPAVGLDHIGEVPGGDVGYLPMALIPASFGEAPVEGSEEGPEAGDKALLALLRGRDTWLRRHKDRIEDAVDVVAVRWEERFGDEAWNRFEAEKRHLLAILNQKKGPAGPPRPP